MAVPRSLTRPSHTARNRRLRTAPGRGDDNRTTPRHVRSWFLARVYMQSHNETTPLEVVVALSIQSRYRSCSRSLFFTAVPFLLTTRNNCWPRGLVVEYMIATAEILSVVFWNDHSYASIDSSRRCYCLRCSDAPLKPQAWADLSFEETYNIAAFPSKGSTNDVKQFQHSPPFLR